MMSSTRAIGKKAQRANESGQQVNLRVSCEASVGEWQLAVRVLVVTACCWPQVAALGPAGQKEVRDRVAMSSSQSSSSIAASERQ